METKLFSHVYFSNNAVGKTKRGQALHVYLEGDGTPWINGQWIATDPTPRKAVMLELMRLDKSPAILLGRPCYHHTSKNSNCHPNDWTMGRYSPKVIDSMVQSIKVVQQRLGFSEIILFGHSGGGVIALLIANALTTETLSTTAVITLASNLDTDAWTAANGYLPLVQSLNPAKLPPLPASTFILHLFAKNDKVVNANLFKKYLSSRTNEESIIYDGFDHSCCWNKVWPSILNKVESVQNSPLKPAVNE